jgi:regulatory protein
VSVTSDSFTVESAEASRDIAAEYLKAEKSALNLIARAEQCSWGLKCKLEKKKYHNDVIQTVLDHLIKLNLVNDLRYAGLWLKSRIAKGTKGPRILSELLRVKGIDRETAEAALAASLPLETEAALLHRCLDKFRKKNPENLAENKSTTRLFLKSEGFSTTAIDEYFEEDKL